jgi:predicted ferric reductase
MKKTIKIGLIILLLANFLVVMAGWWAGSHQLFRTDLAGVLLAMGRLSGLLAVFCVLLEFLLMAKPNWLERYYGLDKLARFHHWNGFLALTFIIVHPILLGFSYSLDLNTGFWSQMWDFILHYEDVANAAIALVLFGLLVVVSVSLVKKRFGYELWFLVHLLAYVAVILAYGHEMALGGSLLSNKLFAAYWIGLYVFVFANLVMFRLAVPLWIYLKFQPQVQKVVQETPGAWSIYIRGKNLEQLKVQPGQFFKVRYLANGFWFQSHPFSVSKVPGEKGPVEGTEDCLRITVKALGDYTSGMGSLKSGTKVLLEGPFGTFTVDPSLDRKYLFIAGGVGITPLIPLIKRAGAAHSTRLLYGSRIENEIIFREELEKLQKELKMFQCVHIISNDQNYRGEKGRLDQEKLLRLVPDLKEREIYLCGPVAMVNSLLVILKQLQIRPGQIHYEKFSL